MWTGSAAAAADPAYRDELIAEAEARGLAATPQWRALTFSAPNLLGGGRTGIVDNPDYDLDAHGKTDLQAELRATIAAFFAPLPADGADAHLQCRKVARYHWLKDTLGFDATRLPEYRCPAFEAWIGDVNRGTLTLIFPAAYLNNPSSMFGHTLIRIDPPGQPEGTRLTSYTIHFAADNRGEQGAIFAVKGLTGGYRGYFSLIPYYDKVSQYSDIENRDIWEYELTFTRDEISRMLEMLWELNEQPIDYYFFTTNCSYVLLALINGARPELQLLDRFPLYAVPVDTVRAVVDEPGLLRRAVFRPSARTRIARLQARLSPADQRLALALTKGELDADAPAIAALPEADRAAVLELAASYLVYLRNTGAITRPKMASRALALLRERSRIALPADQAPEAPEHTPVRPDQGHDSGRLAAGFGMTGKRLFAEVSVRAVYHDSLDPPAGFVDGASIELGSLTLRQYGKGHPLIEQVTAIAIQSLSPRDEIFGPLSWQTRIGLDRWRKDGDDAGEPVFSLAAAAGPAWRLGSGAIVSPQIGGALLGSARWPQERIFDAGPGVDLTYHVTPAWTLHASAYQRVVVGSDQIALAFAAGLAQGFRLDRNLSLRLEAGVRNDGAKSFMEWSSTLNWYF